MKKLLFLLLPLLTLVSCQENINDGDSEFDNWEARNPAFFLQKTAEGRAAIAEAKENYGDDWAQHCNYRFFRKYLPSSTAQPTAYDSICVEILEQGTGSGCPLATDYVTYKFLKRLIPSDSYAEGKVVDHSGLTVLWDDIFKSSHSAAVTRLANNNTVGETTAFMYMHIGDLWRVYVPAALAYGATATSTIPAYSVLVVDMKLNSYNHP